MGARRRAGLAARCTLLGSTVAAAAVLLLPTAAQAHSLDSSTISAHVVTDASGATTVDATVSVPVETLETATGAAYGDDTGGGTSQADAVTDYLADHLAATGSDGATWPETFGAVTRESVEGVDSFGVDVLLTPTTDDTSSVELTYDAVIEAVPDHEAVVVLTDAAGDVSTPGVLTSDDTTLTVDTGAGTGSGPAGGQDGAGLLDMVGHGFHHVLEGADHLLFLTTLLLTAPMAFAAGRWRRRTGLRAATRDVLGIVTTFTVGHSVTLIASAMGWVSAPTTPVEVLVALSVGVAAVHAITPLVRGGERWIALGFGLVHGLAFAGILTDLGFEGGTSVLLLLAFNLGVELAQLAATLLVFPSLYLLSRTRWYAAARLVGAGLALAASTAWALDRLGVLADPLAGVEQAVVAHPWCVVVALAALAATAHLRSAPHDRPTGPGQADPGGYGGAVRPPDEGAPPCRHARSAHTAHGSPRSGSGAWG